MDKNYTLRAKSFYKFLLKNRLFDMYLAELRNQHPNKLIDYDKNGDILELLVKTENIDRSFYWNKTIQGFKFWSDLNSREKREYNMCRALMDIMRNNVNYL